MRILFFKVFALILFSAVILFAVVSAVFHVLDDDDFDIGYEFAYRTAHKAAAIYEADEAEGFEAVERELAALHRRTGVRAFLMHGDGRAIGRALPTHLKERWARRKTVEGLRHTTDDDDDSRHGRHAIYAVRITTERGRTYRLMMTAGHRNARTWFFADTKTRGKVRVVMSLLVIALASLLISLLITRPLGGLKTATQKFSGGNLSARAPARITKRNDAFGELAREFDRMSMRIEKLIGGHRRLLRDVSHELRSPLSRMQVAATLLEDDLPGGDEADARRQVARIQAEILRLESMIARLLSVARLQAGAVAPALESVDVYGLLQRVARDAVYEFSDQGKDVKVNGFAARVEADPEQLRSAFENVIRNGLRYTKSALVVTLDRVESGAPPASMARVTVADDGPGVAEDELQNIFAPFYRPDQSRSEATGNAGIGLAIARGIVTAHGGRIEAANAASGGLIVTILLPVA